MLWGASETMSDASFDYELSVVIPVHNSAPVLERTIERWKSYVDEQETQLLLVENGSTDSSWELARSLANDTEHVHFTLLQSPKGMGNALRAGILRSSGRRILLSADDLPFGFDDLEQAGKLSHEPAVIIGSKAHRDSQVARGLARSVFTVGYRVMRFLVLGSRVGDTQGTILADGRWLRDIAPGLDESGFLFTTQLVRVAEVQRLEIIEVPVTLYDEHDPNHSTVSWSDVVDMARGLSRVRQSAKRVARDTAGVKR